MTSRLKKKLEQENIKKGKKNNKIYLTDLDKNLKMDFKFQIKGKGTLSCVTLPYFNYCDF